MPNGQSQKLIFTTFEAAKLCNANITSIKNWIEQGEIAAFRTPGGHYRIEREALSGFLDRHNMPNPLREEIGRTVLAIHRNDLLMKRIADSLGETYQVITTPDPVDGLIRLGHMKPRAVVVDASIDGTDPVLICRSVNALRELGPVGVVVCEVDDMAFAECCRDAGAVTVVERGSNDLALVQALMAALQM